MLWRGACATENKDVRVQGCLRGCGRPSTRGPAGSRAGPNSSTKMKGPTIVRCFPGSVRLTLKSPRSCVTGVIVCRIEVSTVAIMALRGTCSDRQRVDSALHQGTERRIDHPLSFDTILSGEGRAFDGQGEVALAGGIVATVTAVLLAVVRQLDPRRRKRRIEKAEHFGRDRTGFSSVHWPYIMGLNGDEAIEAPRTGRGGAGEVRRPRLRRAR